MTDNHGGKGGDRPAATADATGSLADTREARFLWVLASMGTGVALGAGVGWGVALWWGIVGPVVGGGLGAAAGGGLGAVAYLFTRPQTDDPGVETVAVPADDEPDGPSTADDLFEAHPDPTLYFTGEGEDVRVMAANPAFEDTFGASASTLAETPLEEVTMTDELGDIVGRLARGSTVDETVACETHSGTSSFRIRSVSLSGDRPQGFLVYTPVGSRESLGDRQSDRVEELARVVSHELRNPLDSARTRVATARDTGDLEHLDTALRNIDRMSSIISDLTTLAREGRLVGTREPVSLGATVEEAWETLDADGATLTVTDDLGRVEADDSALEHLVENLLRNAVEHGSTDGRTESDDAPESASTGSRPDAGDGDGDGSQSDGQVSIRVGSLADGFYVADDGPGIPPEERDRVFEAGYTTTREGTGLGLRIVERVAEAHGWEVSVTESESGGARFEITGVDRPA